MKTLQEGQALVEPEQELLMGPTGRGTTTEDARALILCTEYPRVSSSRVEKDAVLLPHRQSSLAYSNQGTWLKAMRDVRREMR